MDGAERVQEATGEGQREESGLSSFWALGQPVLLFFRVVPVEDY